MGMALKKETMNAADYLVWEETQMERHEFVAGEVFAMAGARDSHNTIALNTATALRSALRGTPCRTFIGDMKLQVDAVDAYFYPDVMVTCDPRDKLPEADLSKAYPRLIVEVLSDSTARYDRSRKFEYYQHIETLQEYLLIEHDRRHVDLFRRNEEGLWVLHPLSDQGSITLASVEVSLDLDLIFEDAPLGTGME